MSLFRFLWPVLFVLLLTSCVRPQQQMGIASAQWRAMSPEERKQATSNYKQITKALDQDTLPPDSAALYNGPSLVVQILKGTAFMPPFDRRYGFKSVAFQLDPGPCRRVRLHSLDTSNYVDMCLCYNGLRLSLDPSYYDMSKSQGTLHFYYNPLWKRGFIYRDIHTSGYARLEHASINIKAITVVPAMIPAQ